MEIRRENYFENEFAKMWLEDDILYMEWAPVVVDLNIAKKVVSERLKIANGVTRPGLSDVRNVITMDKDAREYFSKGDSLKQANAFGVIIGNLLHKFIGNVFLKINKPSIPIKLFSEKDHALQWLQQFK